jgi:hypothetical protein
VASSTKAEEPEEFDPTAPPEIPPPVPSNEGPLWGETDEGVEIPQYPLSKLQSIPIVLEDAKFFPSQFVESGQEPRDYAVVLFHFLHALKGKGPGVVATTRSGSSQIVELLKAATFPAVGMFVTKTSRAGREYAALVPPEEL